MFGLAAYAEVPYASIPRSSTALVVSVTEAFSLADTNLVGGWLQVVDSQTSDWVPVNNNQ